MMHQREEEFTEARRSEHMLSGMPSTWKSNRGKFTQLRCIGGHVHTLVLPSTLVTVYFGQVFKGFSIRPEKVLGALGIHDRGDVT